MKQIGPTTTDNGAQEIVFYSEHKGERFRVTVYIDDHEIARLLGARALSNRTHRSTLAGLAKAKAVPVK